MPPSRQAAALERCQDASQQFTCRRAEPTIGAAHDQVVPGEPPQQLRQTAPAAEFRLSPDDLAQIGLIQSGEVAVSGPAPERMP